MSAPVTDLPSSVSSSGHTDGLGRRLLAFDRETGAMRERLYLRPELSAFAIPLQRRVQRLTTVEDERFARPCAVQREPETGELTVVSEFIPGSRLSDLIETAQDAASVPGVDAALGFLLGVLPALATLHSTLGITHGLIDPTRMVITPAGQIVLLDTSFGEVVERLMLSPARLWAEFGIAIPPSSLPVRLDAAGDLRQVTISAMTLMVGRRVGLQEVTLGLTATLSEVNEIAQIRGSAAFASGLQAVLQRCLSRADPGYLGAEAMAAEIRALAAEIGEDVCRRSLVEFVEQMDAFCSVSRQEPETSVDAPEGVLRKHDLTGSLTAALHLIHDEESDLATALTVVDPDGDSAMVDEQSAKRAGAERADDEISLDALTFGDTIAAPVDEPAAPPVVPLAVPEPTQSAPPELVSAVAAMPVAPASLPAAPGIEDEPAGAPVSPDGDETGRMAAEIPTAPTEPAGGSGRRRKRQQRSARERKDRLRSAAANRDVASKAPGRLSPWIVSPARAAAFEPPVDPPPLAQPGPAPAEPAQPAPIRVVPLPVFTPVAAPLQATAPPGAPSVPSTPLLSMASTDLASPAVSGRPVPITPVAQSAKPRTGAKSGGLRIKAEPPPGFRPTRTVETMAMGPPETRGPLFGTREPARFPTRLAVVLVGIVAVAIVAGRFYLASTSSVTNAGAAMPAVEPPVVVAPQPESGEIVVRSQPAGVRVLLDGKPVGETPLKLTSVSVGRHVLGFVSAAGEVTRTVRVAAGEALEIDVPVFSGWLAVFAPIVIDVSLNGRSLGTTEQSRLMLPPGRHKVTLANRDLGYRAVETVDIEPGEVRSITIEPRGHVNLNASPWAEVWLDGRKLGDTPIAGIQIPLGVREFVFRHPDHGERKTTAVVRADQPVAVSVDFGRSGPN